MISWVLVELLLLVRGFDARNTLEKNKIANSVHAYVCSLRLVMDDEACMCCLICRSMKCKRLLHVV